MAVPAGGASGRSSKPAMRPPSSSSEEESSSFPFTGLFAGRFFGMALRWDTRHGTSAKKTPISTAGAPRGRGPHFELPKGHAIEAGIASPPITHKTGAAARACAVAGTRRGRRGGGAGAACSSRTGSPAVPACSPAPPAVEAGSCKLATPCGGGLCEAMRVVDDVSHKNV